MNHERETAFAVLAKYLKRNEARWTKSPCSLPTAPRVDPRSVVAVREFEPVKGADAETAAMAAVDNSIVDRLAKEGFIEKVCDKAIR